MRGLLRGARFADDDMIPGSRGLQALRAGALSGGGLAGALGVALLIADSVLPVASSASW